MKLAIFQKLRVLFVISLILCMGLGSLLTVLQLIGALLQIPELITQSEHFLLKPAIASAAAFGLFSFIASYFQPGGQGNDEEAEEI